MLSRLAGIQTLGYCQNQRMTPPIGFGGGVPSRRKVSVALGEGRCEALAGTFEIPVPECMRDLFDVFRGIILTGRAMGNKSQEKQFSPKERIWALVETETWFAPGVKAENDTANWPTRFREFITKNWRSELEPALLGILLNPDIVPACQAGDVTVDEIARWCEPSINKKIRAHLKDYEYTIPPEHKTLLEEVMAAVQRADEFKKGKIRKTGGKSGKGVGFLCPEDVMPVHRVSFH